MGQKQFLIIAVIVICLVGAAIFTVFTPFITSNNDVSLNVVPHIYLEGTVTSLYFDALTPECVSNRECPYDKMTIRIDKINNGAENESHGFFVGDENTFVLTYSARPVRLINDIPPICGSGEKLRLNSCVSDNCTGNTCPVSSPTYLDVGHSQLDGNNLSYHFPMTSGQITEKALPGLAVGSRIKISVNTVPWVRDLVGIYELI